MEPNVQHVISFLANHSQRWLLVIDNADNLDMDYSKYIPPTRVGDVLLTTRNSECCMNQTAGSEMLHGLELKLAQELLLKASSVPQSRWKDKESAAMHVVKILDLHTLAIVQAGAFIRQRLCTLEQYSAIFQQRKDEILRFNSKEKLSTYGNVYATFEVSARYLEDSATPAASDALNLVHIFAYLNNNEVSEAIFERASEYTPELESVVDHENSVLSLNRSHIDKIPDYVQQPWSASLQDRLRWRKACAMLESLSIITMRNDDEFVVFSIHTLVHAWAKERQDFGSRCEAWRMAATIVALSCQGWYSYHPSFVTARPHIQSIVQNEIESYTKDVTDLETAQLLFQCAYVLMAMRDDDVLKVLVEQINSRLQGAGGITPVADSEVILQIKYLNGSVYYQEGKFTDAITVFEEILDSRARELDEDQLDEDHPDRLASQHALAGAYEANGQIDQAIQLLEYVVRIREKLAEDHPSRLASQHALAGAYEANGQIDQAIQLLEHVVRIEEKLAEDHPSRLASQHALAGAYEANGQIDQAIQLLEYVVRIREKLAEDHPSRLASQHALAGAYEANGQIDQAIQLLEYVVRIREKLAEDHPSRLASQHALAGAYEANGQIDQAIQLLEHVVRIREKLVEDHPSRLASQHDLAAAYRADGQIDRAVQLLEHIS